MVTRTKTATESILYFLEKAYLTLSNSYGLPAVTSPKVWGPEGTDARGVFEVMNEELRRSGMRPLSWEEFKQLLKTFDSPRWYGIVHVMYAMGKTNKVEPITITIYRPLMTH